MVRVGEQAPDFKATSAEGEFSLAGQRGRNVVLFFYPGDFTSVCTKEACEFRDYSSEFESRNAVVVGVSPDDAESHRKFAGQYRLNFALLSDPQGKLVDRFGIRPLLPFLPRKRVTFVIDGAGIVRAAIDSLLDYRGHVEGALKALDQLKS